MSVYFRIFQHLAPKKNLLWKMPPGSRIRKFFEVFIDFQQDFRLFIELIYNDLDPEQTRQKLIDSRHY